MLEREWRKGNPTTLLVGMKVGIATMENSMKVPQKTKNKTPIWSNNPTPGHISGQNYSSRRYMQPYVYSSNQPKCPWTDEWIKKIWYTYNTMKYYSVMKNQNNVICSHMDRPRDYHIKWTKLDKEKLSLICGI